MLPVHAPSPIAGACNSLRENKIRVLDLSSKFNIESNVISVHTVQKGKNHIPATFLIPIIFFKFSCFFLTKNVKPKTAQNMNYRLSSQTSSKKS